MRNPSQWNHPLHPALHLVQGDIRDPSTVQSALDSVDGVFHLAAATTASSLAKSRAINVLGMKTLVEAIRSRPNPPKLVFVSSLAVAGAKASQAVTEDMECRPVSNYGRTKLEAEQVLRSVAHELPATIVRPPCVFGPFDRNLLILFRSVRKGWNICAGSAGYRFSFLYVKDLVLALLAAFERGQLVRSLEDPENTGIYYLAHPQPVSFAQIAQWIAPCFGRTSVRSLRVPLPLCWLFAGLSEGLGRLTGHLPFINLDKMRDARLGSWICRPDRAVSELQFEASTELNVQLRETFEWYQSQGWLA
jgi:nucleoside-diphosphate-sugar epimerase